MLTLISPELEIMDVVQLNIIARRSGTDFAMIHERDDNLPLTLVVVKFLTNLKWEEITNLHETSPSLIYCRDRWAVAQAFMRAGVYADSR